MTHSMAARRLAAALAACGLATATAAGSAHAAFTSPFLSPCSGYSIDGRGASFQADAQLAWRTEFASASKLACPSWSSAGKSVSYDPAGSGAGRSAFGGGSTGGTRDANIRFAGTDEPPPPSEQAQMEEGDPLTSADNGDLRTIPVAQSSIVVAVHFPEGCTIPVGLRYKPASGSSAFPSDGTTRFRPSAISGDSNPNANDRVEHAFAGDSRVDTWGELVPGIFAVTGGPKTTQQCAAYPIRRVVRLDNGGTTFQFKHWLNVVNANRSGGWTEPGLANQAWPNSDTRPVLRPEGKGNGPVATLLSTTEGGISYFDLAQARNKGFTMTPGPSGSPVGVPNDRTFYIPVYNEASPQVLLEAQKATMGYKSTQASGGANCGSVSYRNIPPSTTDRTLANWFDVIGVGSPTGYSICTLTFALAWDDAADVYGRTLTEQGKARSVRDYLQYVVRFDKYKTVDNGDGTTSQVLDRSGGQSRLTAADYAAIPFAQSLQSIALTGASRIGWNK